MSTSEVAAAAGILIGGLSTAVVVLWRALNASQEARIADNRRHENDLATILNEVKKKKGA